MLSGITDAVTRLYSQGEEHTNPLRKARAQERVFNLIIDALACYHIYMKADETNNSQIIIYKDVNGKTKIDVRFDDETVWLTQDLMAKLFDKGRSTITEHIRNIFKENELEEEMVGRDFRHTTRHGAIENKMQIQTVKYYNLAMIIAVGYRVKSKQGTSFRKWATERLSEFIVKGFVIDDERLKNPDLPFDYFEELTRRIADIRTSEKRFYRKITDIYATSVDYDPTSDSSILFFKTLQNKVHFAITGQSAAEIIVSRIDEKKTKLGLTNSRCIEPTKDEIIIAKNYLSEEELRQLNSLVEQYLIFAEEQARRRIPMKMNDWIEKLHGFLKLNDRDILKDAGKISHELMKEVSENKFEKYKKLKAKEDMDFDKNILEVLKVVEKKNQK